MLIASLVFKGEARQALDFYQEAFNCQASQVIPYGDYRPEGLQELPEDLPQWILHSQLQVAGSTLWCYDSVEPVKIGNNIDLVLTLPKRTDLQPIFDALKVGGQVILPATETYYSTCHMAVKDKYGILWNLIAEEAPKK